MAEAPARPAVSVLVPSHNKREHIEQTLQSVYAQGMTDWELIVVDDGSTDGSAELLRAHEPRATVILTDNRGASAARQHALGRARGRYVQYLDADDLLLPHALETRVAALERTGADVAYADWQRFRGSPDERGETVARTMRDVHPDPEIACFTRFWAPPAALLYRRTLLERMPPWSATLPVIQDARYLFEAAYAGARFEHVPGVSALYRDDADNSLSRRSNLAFARDVSTNADEVETRWRQHGELDASKRRALAEAHGYVARIAFTQDAELFQRALDRLRAIGELRATSWPFVAAALRRTLGLPLAVKALSALGRAPG